MVQAWIAAGVVGALVGAVLTGLILGGLLVRRVRALAQVRGFQRQAEMMARLGSASRNLRTGRSRWSEGFRAIIGQTDCARRPSLALFLSRVHPADRAVVSSCLVEAIRNGVASEAEARIILTDGGERVVRGRIELVRDRNGRAARLDYTVQDVTERRRLENELDALIRELWRSNEELEQFAYVTSHDLRQPLRVIGSYVSLLAEDMHGRLDGESVEYMGFILDGVRRMDRLITDLLDYSRVGRQTEDRPVEIARVLDAVLADLAFDIVETGAHIEVAKTLPTVLGDESEFERLFSNLIVNALKYRHPDRVPRVRVSCEDLGGDWLVRVADNGIGIPADHAERVFGIFQRLHSREAYEGTGVGLAIVRKIVSRHGGSVRVEPAREGTVLAIRWPKWVKV